MSAIAFENAELVRGDELRAGDVVDTPRSGVGCVVEREGNGWQVVWVASRMFGHVADDEFVIRDNKLSGTIEP